MKKGFTLIELLAVIVILSIILLIAVPIALRVIKDSKKSTAKDSLELYGRAVENGVANYFMKNPEEDEVTMDELKEGEYIQYKGTVVECEEVQIYERNVYLASCKVGDTNIDDTYGTHIVETKVQQKKNYIGYYADVDGDGTVDGVIYADLAHSKSGKWGPYNNNQYIDNGEYSYEALEDLKEYTISENKYTGEKAKFGEKEIITLKSGSSGNSRFYVMALNDFTTEAYTDPNDSNNNYPAYTTYYWYYNAHGKMPYPVKDTSTDFGTGYENTGTMIRIWNNNGEEVGWTTGTTQDKQDIWKHIQEKYNSKEKWYVPSKGEWAAFADYLAHSEENPLTNNCPTALCGGNGNYDDIYGLSGWYWSSSQNNTNTAWFVGFYDGGMNDYDVYNYYDVRLSTTF